MGEAEELVAESFEARQKEAQKRRKKKKKTDRTLVASTFADLYKLTGETLGEGSYGKVETCVNIYTGLEYAVKVIEKRRRSRVNFWDKMNKFCSIDELDLESDFFMKAIV